MSEIGFDEKYPNIAWWVREQGWIEIGWVPMQGCFVRAIEEGGLVWEGRTQDATLDDALDDLEQGVKRSIKEIFG